MARYLLKKNAFIGSRWCRAGSIVDFDGVPGPHMEALESGPVEPAAEPVEPVVKKSATKATAKATP